MRIFSNDKRRIGKAMRFPFNSAARGAALLALLPLAAEAGRPLGTDDAGTAGANTCQVESWLERNSGTQARTWVVSPACGLGDAVEINLELARTVPDGGTRLESGLGVKWVDPAWKSGAFNWGMKAWRRTAHGRASPHWAPLTSGAMGLLTWKAAESVSMHGNLGFETDHAAHTTQPLLNLALSWEAAPSLTLVAEVMAQRRSPTQRNLGARWWVKPERLALDLTAGRTTGAAAATNVTVGFGWYGIGW